MIGHHGSGPDGFDDFFAAQHFIGALDEQVQELGGSLVQINVCFLFQMEEGPLRRGENPFANLELQVFDRVCCHAQHGIARRVAAPASALSRFWVG